MPTAARRDTATSDDTPSSATSKNATTKNATTSEEASSPVKAEASKAADDVTSAGSATASSLRQIVTMPVTVARAVADDVVSTARRPDAVLYLGGLVGLAVLGVLEWPVAAVAGAGVAVASGVRRVRA
jgi:hypothetical protein